jgi:hypothetical protein
MKKKSPLFNDDGIIIKRCSTQMLAAEKNPTSVSNTPKEVPAEVKVLLNRLDEIKAMDKSSLNLQKKELRKEVRAIKAE